MRIVRSFALCSSPRSWGAQAVFAAAAPSPEDAASRVRKLADEVFAAGVLDRCEPRENHESPGARSH